jgi:hypothetical protein
MRGRKWGLFRFDQKIQLGNVVCLTQFLINFEPVESTRIYCSWENPLPALPRWERVLLPLPPGEGREGVKLSPTAVYMLLFLYIIY